MSTLALTNTNIFNLEDDIIFSYENKCKNLLLKRKNKKVERKISYHENEDKINYKKKEISSFRIYSSKISEIFSKSYVPSIFRKASDIRGKCAEERFFTICSQIKYNYPELGIKSIVKTGYSLDSKGIDFIINVDNQKTYFFQIKSSIVGVLKHFKKYKDKNIRVIIVNDNYSDKVIINKIVYSII